EDSQYRLKKLCGTLSFLVRLARPRSWDEEHEREPTVYAGDMAVCLELLAEQADRVLDELSWPATRQAAVEGDDDGATLEAVPPVSGAAAGKRVAFGITPDQIEALDRLVQTLRAHGDVVGSDRASERADRTLRDSARVLREAAIAVQAILEQVRAQRLGRGGRPDDRVDEERAIYAVGIGALRIENRGRSAVAA
ncbi:MAG TPA: hypothetical protein VGC30_14535, partial [Dokdonella sp.]